MPGDIHVHNTFNIDGTEILRKLDHLLEHIHEQNIKLNIIMANFEQLKTQFDALTTAIAEERAQATAKLAELQQSIDDLTTNIQEGGTAEQRDELLAAINTQITEVKAIIPDPAPEG